MKKKMFAVKSRLRAGGVTVFGSPNCPKTIRLMKKLESRNIEFKFTDCTLGNAACPDFVDAFPTTVVTGYSAIWG